MLAFPDFRGDYESDQRFPLFKKRALSSKRTDFAQYIRWLDLDRGEADPISILLVSGGQWVTAISATEALINAG